MEFDLYRIDPEYLKYIQQYDKLVPRKDMRPYVAVCLNVSGHLYALPITSKRLRDNGKKRNSLTTTELITNNEKDSGAILYNNMLPVTLGVMQRIDINKENAVNRESLNKKVKIIRKKSNKIKEKAEHIYDLRCSGQNDFINNFCCDFKLLEQKLSEYLVYQNNLNPSGKTNNTLNETDATKSKNNNPKQQSTVSDKLPALTKLLSEAKQKANEINQARQTTNFFTKTKGKDTDLD